MSTQTAEVSLPQPNLRFLWAEITGKCPLSCTHCYASSGPTGTHGTMKAIDWIEVLEQAADMNVRLVQFIGGEPTLYPHLPLLIGVALDAGLNVEVYTNLVTVSEGMWATFCQPGVQLATSYYSDDPVEHMKITGGNTLDRTRSNIERAVTLGIPIRAGIVEILPGQRTLQAKQQLNELGVTKIGADRLRLLGRPNRSTPAITELCGNCGRRSAAVLPDGKLVPCPFSRWMTGMDVREAGLQEALAAMRPHAERIATTVKPVTMCGPDNDGQCHPCEPSCNPGCDPGVSDGNGDDDG
ncbi:radical SAM/SPASM domain-containing protein [Nonomuraea polychroma]|uniref:radical SAM/SPASM domain-containing protein n=1 Tax=Nonomuraea polychroma TaxID=46176 RepID=UPI003D93715A